MVASERMTELTKCIRALTPDEQELLRLRYVADLSFAEMAELLRMSEGPLKKEFIGYWPGCKASWRLEMESNQTNFMAFEQEVRA